MIVPFNDTTTEYTTDNNESFTNSNGYTENVYSALVIPDRITVNFESEATLNVGAHITTGVPDVTVVRQRGVIVNYGQINIKSSSTVNSYGYIKGNGELNLENGTSALDCMRIFDWPGGTAAMAIQGDVFPSNAWSMHNISCFTKINAGATYSGFILLNLSSYELESKVVIMGKTSTSNCLFKPLADGTDDYILKYSNANYSITSTNQDKNQRDVIKMYGDYTDATLSISARVLLFSVNISTSLTKPCPMGYVDITLGSNSSLSLTHADYLFLPGTTLTIEEKATVTIGKDVDLTLMSYDKLLKASQNPAVDPRNFVPSSNNDAKLLLNGTLNNGGNLSGYIYTNNTNAKLNITGNVTSSFISLSGTDDPNRYYSGTEKAFGNIGNEPNSSFTKGNYIVKELDSTKFWYKPGSATLTYNATLGSISSTTQAINIAENTGYTIPNDINTTVVPTAPNKLYEFAGWYLDSSYSTSAAGTTIWKDMTLYAKWNMLDYTIKYDIDNYMDGTPATGTPSYSKVTDVFNANTNSIILSNPSHSLNYNFAGWYYDSSYSNKINNFNLNDMAALAEYADSNKVVTLYALWYSDPIEVTYVNSNSDYDSYLMNLDSKYKEIPADIGKVREFLLPDGIDDRNDDTEYTRYFVGWYLDSEYTIKVTSFSNEIELSNSMIEEYIESKQLTLYAKWEDKYEVSYYVTKSDKNIKETLKTSEWYYKETINVFGTGNQETILPNYYIDSWTINEVESDELAINIDKAYAIHYNALQVFTITVTTNQYCNIVITFTDGYYKNGSNDVMKKANSSEVTLSNGTSYVYATVNSTFTVDASAANGGKNQSHDYTGNGTLTESISITGTGESCLVEGTLITMADGTKKKVEDVVPGDMLLIINHETGKYDVAPVLFNDSEEISNYTVINLVFSDGTIIKVVSEHGFFDLDLMKYVYIDEINHRDFIGHQFYYSDIINNSIVDGKVTLVDSYITTEYTRVYSPVTKYHLNYFTNNLLSMPGGIDGLFNIFEYDENLKYNEEKKQNDIETYGLYTYEDFKDLVSYEIYESFPANYFAVAIGKGLLTWDDIYYYIERYTPLM